MTRVFRLAFAVVFLATVANASTTVSGTMKDVASAAQYGNGTYVQYDLVNCDKAVPVAGGSVIVNRTTKLKSDSSGAFSGSLTANDQIACANGAMTSYYRQTFYVNGEPVPASRNVLLFDGSAFNPGTSAVCANGGSTSCYLVAATAEQAVQIPAASVSGSNTWTGTNTFSGPLVNTGTDSGAQTITGAKTFAGDVQTKVNPWIDVRAYGVVGNGTTDDVTAFNSAATAACNTGVALLIPSGYTVELKSRPAAFACGLTIIAANFNSVGSAYSYGAFIKCDYNDPGTSGCLTWSGSAAGTKGNGGGLWGVDLRVTSGNTVGAAIALTATDCTARAGDLHFVGFKIAADGTGLWDYGVYVDGSACTTSGTQGVRDVWLTDGEIFSTATDAVYFNNCVHCSLLNITTSPGNGVGDVAVTGAGGGTSASTDVRFGSVAIFGNLTLDYVTQFAGAGTLVTGNYSSTANTTTSWLSGIVGGTVTNNGGVALYLKDRLIVQGTISSSGAIQSTSSAVIGGSAPTGCSGTGYGCFSSSATQGTTIMGSDGNFIARRNNSQYFLSFDALSTQSFVFDNSNGFQTKATTFATLGTCNSTNEGFMRAITDSATATWGATITGGSTNHVLAYCDGTNWTVAGK